MTTPSLSVALSLSRTLSLARALSARVLPLVKHNTPTIVGTHEYTHARTHRLLDQTKPANMEGENNNTGMLTRSQMVNNPFAGGGGGVYVRRKKKSSCVFNGCSSAARGDEIAQFGACCHTCNDAREYSANR